MHFGPHFETSNPNIFLGLRWAVVLSIIMCFGHGYQTVFPDENSSDAVLIVVIFSKNKLHVTMADTGGGGGGGTNLSKKHPIRYCIALALEIIGSTATDLTYSICKE